MFLIGMILIDGVKGVFMGTVLLLFVFFVALTFIFGAILG